MSDRVIVITGVSRGLGRALALEFARGGHTVLGCARDGAALIELGGALGAEHELAVVDVALAAEVEDWAGSVVDRHGAPDLVVANAALINRSARLWELEPEEFAAVCRVNVEGVFHVNRAFLPAMLDAGRGVLVNLSSTWGRSVAPEVAPYCATKWAIEGLTRALAQELPRGLAAVPLNPGVIDTEMLRSCLPDAAPSCEKPEDWARRAAPFLLGLGPEDNGVPATVP